ncbi:MAG: hypothetical protein K2O42_07645 [Oscillospiraceae bacterium]|nr:hypothetical protein [Oscillospiraceae bacterium]
MNKIFKAFYQQWSQTKKDTPEYLQALAVFCEDGKNIKSKQENSNCDIFFDCVFAESEQAFCAGFQTAVQFLADCMRS